MVTRLPMRGPYQAPYTPVAGFTDPGYTNPGYTSPGYTNPGYTQPGFNDPAVPPVPPVPPMHWRRKEPIGAMILVGIGLILLLNEMGYVAERFLHFLWPLLFIALGVWLIIRRMNDSKGGAAMNRYILIRRLTGPAILLLLGIVALLHEADLASWNLFVPLLLILIGVLKLAQRAALAAAGR